MKAVTRERSPTGTTCVVLAFPMSSGRPLSPDTRPEIEAVHLELLRKAGPGRRAEMVRSLSATMVRLSRAAVAKAHPELDAAEARLRWVEIHYGAALAAGVRARLARP